jgi:hypothetical protein
MEKPKDVVIVSQSLSYGINKEQQEKLEEQIKNATGKEVIILPPGCTIEITSRGKPGK